MATGDLVRLKEDSPNLADLWGLDRGEPLRVQYVYGNGAVGVARTTSKPRRTIELLICSVEHVEAVPRGY